MRYNELSVLIRSVDERHAFLFDPYLKELTHADGRILLIEGLDQIVPGGILKHVFLDEITQSVLHLCGTDDLFQGTHHDRCLIIYNVVVEQSRVIDNRRLLNGMRTVCTVQSDSLVLEGGEEIHVALLGIHLPACDLRGHNVCHHFLFPQVLCPVQLNDVAKPEV